MHEELNQFKRNEVWDIVPKPTSHKTIGTKWVFQNKHDESGIIVRNKQDWLQKVTAKKKESTMMKPTLQLQG